MSRTFEVMVERRLYVTGSVFVEAEDHDAAIELVESQIDSGELQTTAVDWCDPSYEECSFMATGDAELSDEDEDEE